MFLNISVLSKSLFSVNKERIPNLPQFKNADAKILNLALFTTDNILNWMG